MLVYQRASNFSVWRVGFSLCSLFPGVFHQFVGVSKGKVDGNEEQRLFSR